MNQATTKKTKPQPGRKKSDRPLKTPIAKTRKTKSARKTDLAADKKAALKLVEKFIGHMKPPAFKHFRRIDVAEGLIERINQPSLIDQPGMVCGPAALMYVLARDFPVKYTRFVIDLYERGTAWLMGPDKGFRVTPNQSLLNFKPKDENAVDWITMASLRDSENTFFNYSTRGKRDDWFGYTMPGEFAKWLRKLGYKEVIDQTNLKNVKGEANLVKAKELQKQGYRVFLLIHSHALSTGRLKSCSPLEGANHWVVLTSPITISPRLKFKVFSWADFYSIPKEGSSRRWAMEHYYGFVAARF